MIFDTSDLRGTYIDVNVDTRILESTMAFVEDAYIKHVLTAEDFAALNGDDLPPREAQIKADLLTAFGWFVNAEIILPLSQKTKNAGLISNTGDGYNSNAISDQLKLRDYYLARAEHFMNDFKKKYNAAAEAAFDNNNFCLVL